MAYHFASGGAIPMSNQIPVMPMDTLKAKVGELIEEAKKRSLPMSLHTLLSISEYLKDAERWQFYVRNGPILGDVDMMTPAELTKYVDQEIENERKRLVCARKRRNDGVPGNQGGGGATDPVV